MSAFLRGCAAVSYFASLLAGFRGQPAPGALMAAQACYLMLLANRHDKKGPT